MDKMTINLDNFINDLESTESVEEKNYQNDKSLQNKMSKNDSLNYLTLSNTDQSNKSTNSGSSILSMDANNKAEVNLLSMNENGTNSTLSSMNQILEINKEIKEKSDFDLNIKNNITENEKFEKNLIDFEESDSENITSNFTFKNFDNYNENLNPFFEEENNFDGNNTTINNDTNINFNNYEVKANKNCNTNSLFDVQTDIENTNILENDSCFFDNDGITEGNISNNNNNENMFSNSVGYLKPYWIPDKEAPNCMNCNLKFTLLKRRHHCRACGKIFCLICCDFTSKLPYLQFKEARVCKTCFNLLDDIGLLVDYLNQENSENIDQKNILRVKNPTTPLSPNQNQIPDVNNQVQSCSNFSDNNVNLVRNSSHVPVSVLKKPDRSQNKEISANIRQKKQVIFLDGIRPGGDLTEKQSISTRIQSSRKLPNFPTLSTFSTLLFPSSSNSNNLQTIKDSSENASSNENFAKKKSPENVNKNIKNFKTIITDSKGPLPPFLNCKVLNCESSFTDLFEYLKTDDKNFLNFQIDKNLNVITRIVFLDCCCNKLCWSFSSVGLCAFGQDEIMILLEIDQEEEFFPRDIFFLFSSIFNRTTKSPFLDNNLILFEEGLFGNKENFGFLFFRPTFQCLKKIDVPNPPYLVGILIHKWEIPWAKIFPLRLLLRLGAEFKCYPCPIISQRLRKSCFYEIGHTIMNVLADFRNFQYTLPFIPGVYVIIKILPNDSKEIKLKIAQNRYEAVQKALASSNEHVLAFGANLEHNSNFHLTCNQNDDGQYQTQIITKDNRVLNFSLNNLDKNNEFISQTIGANFIVFSGALKTTTGSNAKFSIVEDGVLIQILPNLLEQLKSAFKDKKDFTINCEQVNMLESANTISVVWSEDDKLFNIGVKSLIDNLNLEGVQNIRIYNGSDCASEKFLIRWTEVFYIEHDCKKSIDESDYTKMAGMIAHTLSATLTPFLENLIKKNHKKISLRVNLDPNNPGYEIATNESTIPSSFVSELDSALIPLIMGNMASSLNEVLVMELIFYILSK